MNNILFRSYYPSRFIITNPFKTKKKNIFSINPESVIALSQQTSLFAAGLFFGSVVLLYSEISITFSICIGLFFSTIMLVSYLKRTADTEDGALDDFPGPRTWPISMALITFFANQTFFQSAIAFFLS